MRTEYSASLARTKSEQCFAVSDFNCMEWYIYYVSIQQTYVIAELDLSRGTEPSAVLMRLLVLVIAYFTLLLFLIGVFDLLLGLWDLVTSGAFTDPLAVIELLDTVLLLLIIVEVHRTLIAYARNEPVVQIVIGAAIIAIAREIIGFRISDFDTTGDALTAAGGFGLLLVALVVAYFVVQNSETQDSTRESS